MDGEAQGRPETESPCGSATASISADVAIVQLRGECDLSVRPQIRAVIDTARDTPGVIIDLSRCRFLDATVVRLLLSARREVAARAGGLELVLPAATYAVNRIIDLMQVRDAFSTHPSFENAHAALGG